LLGQRISPEEEDRPGEGESARPAVVFCGLFFGWHGKRATRKAGEGWAATRESRGVIKRAAEDLRQGLQDTDLRARRPKQR